MQNLVLAVQNSVDVGQVGAASSLVAFLRSMGGTVGVTVLGVVLSHRVSTLLGLSASATVGTGDLSGLDPAAAAAVRAAYGDAIGLVFLIAAVASLLTLAAVLFIQEVPLRTTVGSAPEQAPTGTATASVTAAPRGRGLPRDGAAAPRRVTGRPRGAPADRAGHGRPPGGRPGSAPRRRAVGRRRRPRPAPRRAAPAARGGARRPRRGRARRARPRRRPGPARLVRAPACAPPGSRSGRSTGCWRSAWAGSATPRPSDDGPGARPRAAQRAAYRHSPCGGRRPFRLWPWPGRTVQPREVRTAGHSTPGGGQDSGRSTPGDDACAQYRRGIRPAPYAARPASTASRMARAIRSGSPPA